MNDVYQGTEIYAIINVIDESGQHVDPDSWEEIKVYDSTGADTGWTEKNNPSPPDSIGGKPGLFRVSFTGVTVSEGQDYTVVVQVTVSGIARTAYGEGVTIVGGTSAINTEIAKIPKRGDGDTYKQLRDGTGTLLQEVRETLTSDEQGA